jgi:phosphohistidine swiveling domain-containing protein
MPKLIIPLKKIEPADYGLVGGKAAQLRHFQIKGFNVPDALIVTGRVYESITATHPVISGIIREIRNKSPEEAEKLSSELVNQFKSLKFPEAFEKLLLESIPIIHFPHFSNVAVRPSPVFLEDPERYVPGFGQSVLNVDKYPDLLDALREIWASHWGYSSFTYRNRHMIPHENISMAVLIQRMAKTDYSGICYSTVHSDPELVQICCGWGIPDGPKKNQVPFDRILIRGGKPDSGRYTFDILEEETADKDKMLVYKGQNATYNDVLLEQALVRILNNDQITELGSITRRVEEFLKSPVEITWGHEKDLVLLGARIRDGESDKKTLWISPSFSFMQEDPVLPLSTSVFRNFVENEFRDLAKWTAFDFDNLYNISEQISGRIYYNSDLLVSLWTKMNIPQKVACRYIENKLVFPADTSADENEELLKSVQFNPGLLNQWLKNLKDESGKKISELNSFINEMETFPYNQADMTTIREMLSKALVQLEGTGLTTSIPAGIFMCLLILAKMDGITSFQEFYENIPDPDLSCDFSFIDNFIYLQDIKEHTPSIKRLFQKQTVETEDLEDIKDTRYYNSLQEFLNTFSYISPSPMEISQPRITENSDLILAILNYYHKTDILSHNPQEETPAEKVKKTKKMSSGLLSSILGKRSLQRPQVVDFLKDLMGLERKLEKNLIQNIAIMRKLASSAGEHLCQSKIIEEPSDVFMMHIDELLTPVDAPEAISMRETIKSRKNLYKTNGSYKTPNLFRGSRLNISPTETGISGNKECILQGIPIYPGRVTGRILRINSYKDFKGMEKDSIPLISQLTIPILPFLINVPGVILENIKLSATDIALLRKLRIPAAGGFCEQGEALETGRKIDLDGENGKLVLLN